MKVSDLVSWNGKVGIVTELYKSKMWRTSTQGRAVSFKDIEPEPFARILVDGNLHGVPVVDLRPVVTERW